MMLKRFGIALLIVLLLASPARANSSTVNDVAKEFICLSGCNMVLSECTCCGEMGLRKEMMDSIKQQIDAGRSKDEIVQSFIAQYGEQVLASPPKKGFNLVAWIAPFVAILAGAAIILFALRAWVKRGSQAPTTTTTESEEGEEEYRRRVEEELKEFREKGFR